MKNVYEPETIPEVQVPTAIVANTLSGSIEGDTFLNGTLRVGGQFGKAGRFVAYDENGIPSIVIEG